MSLSLVPSSERLGMRLIEPVQYCGILCTKHTLSLSVFLIGENAGAVMETTVEHHTSCPPATAEQFWGVIKSIIS